MHDNETAILVVDDQPGNLKVLIDFLTKSGFHVYVADSGERSLSTLNNIEPDLILLDVMMPGMNGFETCRKIKENKTWKNIPVIFMTALNDVESKLAGFEAGGVDYITKPFQQVEVLARINTHLKLRRRELQLADSEKKMATIIEFLPDPTWVIDLDGKIVSWNKAVEDYTGVKKDDMLGKGNYEHAIPFYGERRPTLVNLVLNRDETWEKKYVQIKIEAGADKLLVGESYHPILGEDGCYLSATASKIYDAQGHVTGAIQSIRDITDLKNSEHKREQLIIELKEAINEIKKLSGLLPICASCKKIRDDEGYWNQIESYIQQHSEAKFSHGMCPECSDKLYGDQDWYIEMKKKKASK